MTAAEKWLIPIHIESDLVDIRIRIRINPEIRIRIPDHILALAEFTLCECSSSSYYYYYFVRGNTKHQSVRGLHEAVNREIDEELSARQR